METIGQSFGRRLRDLREKRGLSRDKLGELIALSSTSIVFIEKGEQWPSAETLEKISAFFEVPPAYFFTDEVVRIKPTPQEAILIVENALNSREKPTSPSPIPADLADKIALAYRMNPHTFEIVVSAALDGITSAVDEPKRKSPRS